MKNLTGKEGRKRDLHRIAIAVFLQVYNSAKSNKRVFRVFFRENRGHVSEIKSVLWNIKEHNIIQINLKIYMTLNRAQALHL